MTVVQLALGIDPDDSDDEDLAEQLFIQACDPLAEDLYQDIGPERLSMERLLREHDEAGGDDRGTPWDVRNRFGFKLADLPLIIQAFDLPEGFQTRTGHVFSGEEGVLLLLLRFRTTDNLVRLTRYTGRSISAISEGVRWVVEYICQRFEHLVDERSFLAWEPRFADLAQVMKNKGIKVEDLIGFIDGKLYYVCRPKRGQKAVYSGHKRVHGIKIQGVVFPNGIQPWPFVALGSRHDGFLLRESKILDRLREVSGRLGRDYRLFGDSAYPLSRYLFRMHKGNMTPQQQAFNDDMGPERVTVEWGFGAIVAQWPYLDFSRKLQILKSPVALYLQVGNVLTNMTTCLYGSEISRHFGMEPPSLSAYMSGGPF